MLEPVVHLAELEKARAGAHPEAGAEQQRQPERPPHHAVDGVVHLCDDLDHTLVSPCTQKSKKRAEPAKGSARKIQALSFFRSRGTPFARPHPLCAKDDGSVLLPERYSRLSLRPYTFGTRSCGLLQSARAHSRARLFRFFYRARLYAIEKLYHILFVYARHQHHFMPVFHL